MSNPRFVIIAAAHFATQPRKRAYQIGERICADFPVYQVVERGFPVDNYPVDFEEALDRLKLAEETE